MFNRCYNKVKDMKKRVIVGFIIAVLCSVAVGVNVSAVTYNGAKSLCSSWGGSWTDDKCTGDSVEAHKSECISNGGSYTSPTNNGYDHSHICTWTFIGSEYKCIGFVVGLNEKVTPKKYCANQLYRKSSAKSYCEVGKNKTKCADYISKAITSKRVTGVGDSAWVNGEDAYARDVAGIMVTVNVDPCAEFRSNSSAYNECAYKANSANWQYYNEEEPGSNNNGNNSNNNDKDKDDNGDSTVASVSEGECATILTGLCNENGITELIKLVIGILTGAIVVAGTIGIIICGVLWMTARDNEAQVVKAKKRILDIVIGIVAWVLLSLLANLFIPKPQTDINKDAGLTTGDAGIESDNKIG